MSTSGYTSIRISKATKELLDEVRLQLFPECNSYDDLIKRLVLGFLTAWAHIRAMKTQVDIACQELSRLDKIDLSKLIDTAKKLIERAEKLLE